MRKTFIPGLKSREARLALAEVVAAMLTRWGLPDDKQAVLLGLPDMQAIREGEPLPQDFDVLSRAGHLLAIDRALQKRFGDNPALRDAWLMFSFSELEGQSALALMLLGLDGIKRVRRLVESQEHSGDEP